MKILLATFREPETVQSALSALASAGCPPSRVSIFTSAEAGEIRELLGEEPAKTAASGALRGTSVGAALGLVGGIALATIPGIGTVLASGLAATAAGGLVGGYYGALIATRLEAEDERQIKTELSKGALLLAVEAPAEEAPEVEIALVESGATYHTRLEREDAEQAAVMDG